MMMFTRYCRKKSFINLRVGDYIFINGSRHEIRSIIDNSDAYSISLKTKTGINNIDTMGLIFSRFQRTINKIYFPMDLLEGSEPICSWGIDLIISLENLEKYNLLQLSRIVAKSICKTFWIKNYDCSGLPKDPSGFVFGFYKTNKDFLTKFIYEKTGIKKFD